MAYVRIREGGTPINLRPGSTQLGDLGWHIKSPISSHEGHEAMTRKAIGADPKGENANIVFTIPAGSGRVPVTWHLTPGQLEAIIKGNRSVDMGWAYVDALLFAFLPWEQKRHALRSSLLQPQAEALADITGYLRKKHAAIVAETDWGDRLELIGQALHLIQDSFSPAHVARRQKQDWCIAYIRNYGQGKKNLEHDIPDCRDEVFQSKECRDKGVSVSEEVKQAIAASRLYLQIVFKAIWGRLRKRPDVSQEAARELNAFIEGKFRACGIVVYK